MKYRNISKQTQDLIGFGVVDPDGIIETTQKINNPNFELVLREKELTKTRKGKE